MQELLHPHLRLHELSARASAAHVVKSDITVRSLRMQLITCSLSCVIPESNRCCPLHPSRNLTAPVLSPAPSLLVDTSRDTDCPRSPPPSPPPPPPSLPAPLASIFFETPSYRRNVQVKTLEQIIAERHLGGRQGGEVASGDKHSM